MLWAFDMQTSNDLAASPGLCFTAKFFGTLHTSERHWHASWVFSNM